LSTRFGSDRTAEFPARQQFQVFLHPPDKIVATAEGHGLKTVSAQTSFFWEVASLRRTTAAPGQ
jgi:hypothetical protein